MKLRENPTFTLQDETGGFELKYHVQFLNPRGAFHCSSSYPKAALETPRIHPECNTGRDAVGVTA